MSSKVSTAQYPCTNVQPPKQGSQKSFFKRIWEAVAYFFQTLARCTLTLFGIRKTVKVTPKPVITEVIAPPTQKIDPAPSPPEPTPCDKATGQATSFVAVAEVPIFPTQEQVVEPTDAQRTDSVPNLPQPSIPSEIDLSSFPEEMQEYMLQLAEEVPEISSKAHLNVEGQIKILRDSFRDSIIDLFPDFGLMKSADQAMELLAFCRKQVERYNLALLDLAVKEKTRTIIDPIEINEFTHLETLIAIWRFFERVLVEKEILQKIKLLEEIAKSLSSNEDLEKFPVLKDKIILSFNSLTLNRWFTEGRIWRNNPAHLSLPDRLKIANETIAKKLNIQPHDIEVPMDSTDDPLFAADLDQMERVNRCLDILMDAGEPEFLRYLATLSQDDCALTISYLASLSETI